MFSCRLLPSQADATGVLRNGSAYSQGLSVLLKTASASCGLQVEALTLVATRCSGRFCFFLRKKEV